MYDDPVPYPTRWSALDLALIFDPVSVPSHKVNKTIAAAKWAEYGHVTWALAPTHRIPSESNCS
jgi:hypothetical protein